MTPVEQIRMTILGIGLSPLSALQSDAERYRRFYSRMLSILSFIYMPLVTFVAIQSEDVIRLLLGEAWLSAAPFLRILSIAAFVQPILGSCRLVMITCGKSGRYLHWGLMSGVGVIIAYAIGILWGATGVAYAYAIATYGSLILMFWYGIKDTPVSALLVIKTVFLPVMSSLGAGIILVLLLPSISSTSMLVNITISVLIIMTAYLGIWLSVPKGREQLAEYWSYSAELFQRA
jgi:PST family polysaccharide transporter